MFSIACFNRKKDKKKGQGEGRKSEKLSFFPPLVCMQLFACGCVVFSSVSLCLLSVCYSFKNWHQAGKKVENFFLSSIFTPFSLSFF